MYPLGQRLKILLIGKLQSIDLKKCDRPYEGTNISQVTGIAEAKKQNLKTLGAIE